ncbi:MAG: shikimate dehydrogenase [Candidatus Omnitrophica bacterium]|nr:shikimate dehydrogenase [Candidatus Omnitrophota bacterium]
MDKEPGSLIYGLLGYPVKHSFSPAMHNAAFGALGINAQYRLFEVKPQDLDKFMGSLQQEGISGLNVTVPYKEKVLEFVELDREFAYLKQLRAVNTIVAGFGPLWGFNTDVPGFSRDLKENINPAGKKAVILGAGGGSRAVAYTLAREQAKEITVCDIDTDRAKGLVEMIKSIFPSCQIRFAEGIERLDIVSKDMLINATPIGLKDTDPCLVKQEMLRPGIFVYDLIYNPAKTKLLALAESCGCKASNGLNMLLYQGMLSFTKWTGKEAPYEVMRQALLDSLSAL